MSNVGKSWSQVKAEIDLQMESDPQRATLSARAVAAVEQGLTHLTGVGHQFEIAPKGTLSDLCQTKEILSQTKTLSIAEAQAHMNGKAKVPDNKFEAQVDA